MCYTMFAASRQSRSTRLFCRVSPNTGEVGQPLILSPCLFDLRGWKHRQRDTESRAGVIQGLRGFFCIYCIEKAGTTKGESRKTLSFCFNTASGMDRMQFKKFFRRDFTIFLFQHRKRYGSHAIPSLTALGTAEPRSGFSKRNALFGKSPQPRGIFLSPKSAENVRKPCNIKETFVHGKNLKLMAFSPKLAPLLQ